MKLSVRNGNDGAIVVVRNRSPMQPRVQRRADFCNRHEQPNCERQNPRREKNPFAHAAVNLAPLILQNICNVASHLPTASLILESTPDRSG
ncbi:MAG: hypothetical protein ACLPRE_01530, partial [Limisphaerales bacterium]